MQVQQDFNLSDADFKLVQDVVHKHCGIALSDEKKALVRARLTKQIRLGGFASAKAYLDHVLSDRGEAAFAEFIDAISTNLTSFFREPQHFSFLTENVLPRLFTEKRAKGDGRLMAWSAACSSGEEPYSLAMTILESIAKLPQGSVRWDVRLLATDISTRMLAAARAGIYSRDRLKGVSPANLAQYFSLPAGARSGEEQCEVSSALRNVIRFRHLNLMDSWPFNGPFDFIFCRNVMIYFDRQTQQELVDRFWNCLRPGGYLFTGHSESLTGTNHRFTSRRPSIYEKPQGTVAEAA
jgi:chemotaxis protein methyltransferase CheR